MRVFTVINPEILNLIFWLLWSNTLRRYSHMFSTLMPKMVSRCKSVNSLPRRSCFALFHLGVAEIQPVKNLEEMRCSQGSGSSGTLPRSFQYQGTHWPKCRKLCLPWLTNEYLFKNSYEPKRAASHKVTACSSLFLKMAATAFPSCLPFAVRICSLQNVFSLLLKCISSPLELNWLYDFLWPIICGRRESVISKARL